MDDHKEPRLSWGILQAVFVGIAFTVPMVIMALVRFPDLSFLRPVFGWTYIAFGLIGLLRWKRGLHHPVPLIYFLSVAYLVVGGVWLLATSN